MSKTLFARFSSNIVKKKNAAFICVLRSTKIVCYIFNFYIFYECENFISEGLQWFSVLCRLQCDWPFNYYIIIVFKFLVSFLLILYKCSNYTNLIFVKKLYLSISFFIHLNENNLELLKNYICYYFSILITNHILKNQL